MPSGNGADTPITFPDPQGDGNVAWEINTVRDKVVARFSKATNWSLLDPQVASEIAEGLSRCAFEASTGRRPSAMGSELKRQAKARATDEVRVRLTQRLVVMLPSMQQQGFTPAKMARNIIDHILKEVT